MNSKTTAELFGENLRNQLLVKNKSQADISRHLKVTEASVSRWVNGLSMPRANMIDKLCVFLHCSVEDLTMKPKKQENPQKYKDRLKRLNDIYLMGNISEDEYRHKSAELQKQIADLSKAVMPKAEVLTKGWKEVYELLDPVHKRAFWHSLLSRIEIDGRDVGRLYFL